MARKPASVLPVRFDNDDAFLFLGRLVGNFRSFAGKLDEFTLFGRALSQSELTTRYEARRPLMPAPSAADEARAQAARARRRAVARRQAAIDAGDRLVLTKPPVLYPSPLNISAMVR